MDSILAETSYTVNKTASVNVTKEGVVVPVTKIEDDFTEIEAKPDENGVSNAQFGNGSLKKAIENALDGIAKLKVTGTEGAVEVKVSIPAGSLGLAKDKGIKKIEVDIGFAVISTNPEVLIKSDGTVPSKIELSVKKVDTSNLSGIVKSLIGNSVIYDISISSDDRIISFGKGDVTIAVSSFSDVKEGAWYYAPIASAEKLGIVICLLIKKMLVIYSSR